MHIWDSRQFWVGNNHSPYAIEACYVPNFSSCLECGCFLTLLIFFLENQMQNWKVCYRHVFSWVQEKILDRLLLKKNVFVQYYNFSIIKPNDRKHWFLVFILKISHEVLRNMFQDREIKVVQSLNTKMRYRSALSRCKIIISK